MAIRDWAKLSCDCGSFEFVGTNELHWKEGQGTAIRPKGYKCSKCDKITSIAALTHKAKDLELQKKIDELRAEQDA
jgi:hypothetical protein